MATSGSAYFDAVRDLMAAVFRSEQDSISEAARYVSTAVEAGGVVHAMGTGHSQALAMELAGRAGGLVPTNAISLRDLVIYGGEDASVLHDPFLERDPDAAHRIFALAPVAPQDVFVVASNSGVNGAVVEFAALVKKHGHRLIAITSRAHSSTAVSRHASGQKLEDLADVVLDNGAPHGDAVLPLPGGGAACGVSSITAALLAQLVVAEAIRMLLERGVQPPVYLSANVPGGDEHNRTLEARYAGRIRRSA